MVALDDAAACLQRMKRRLEVLADSGFAEAEHSNFLTQKEDQNYQRADDSWQKD